MRTQVVSTHHDINNLVTAAISHYRWAVFTGGGCGSLAVFIAAAIHFFPAACPDLG